jgi:hypothetical protein
LFSCLILGVHPSPHGRRDPRPGPLMISLFLSTARPGAAQPNGNRKQSPVRVSQTKGAVQTRSIDDFIVVINGDAQGGGERPSTPTGPLIFSLLLSMGDRRGYLSPQARGTRRKGAGPRKGPSFLIFPVNSTGAGRLKGSYGSGRDVGGSSAANRKRMSHQWPGPGYCIHSQAFWGRAWPRLGGGLLYPPCILQGHGRRRSTGGCVCCPNAGGAPVGHLLRRIALYLAFAGKSAQRSGACRCGGRADQ